MSDNEQLKREFTDEVPGWFDKWGFKSDLSRYLRVTHRLRHSYFSMMGPLIL